MDTEKECAMWMVLNALPEIGPATFRRLKERFDGKIRDVFSASFEELAVVGGVSNAAAKSIANWRNHFNLDQEQRQLAVAHAQFLSQKNKNYPPLLREIYDAPIGLYAKGELDLSRNHCVAIVGTRKATLYGLKLARDFARELASIGCTVVSGMALGIDSAAHEGALAAEGRTVVVLGSGIDVIYPRENKKLYTQIAERGMILSEFRMGRKADRITFPIRNRIIAGMCSHLIVIESDAGGGSMITANMANEYGRVVMAVPGRVDQQSSRGCHALIRQGATLVSSMDDILEELRGSYQQNLNFDTPKTFGLQCEALADPVERCIIDFLKSNGEASLDEISDALAIPMHHLVSRLQLLELRRFLQCDRNGRYVCYEG
ncbi:MAG: DNA-processing protein DprA [Puniceicoccales bacterium]|jgi:DNA processing protein|nr:DNA-processing protein DprA [Puniceicoccales bacterium]